ncbi:MAG: hypothetical protein LUF78_11685 [Clostridiales bacterium]|nr:hypothetical protein [Clostridiales bacterium]
MSSQKKSTVGKKGEYGYFSREKKHRLLITAGLFALPLTVYFVAWWINGSRETVWTVLAVVGCLPGCRSMVSLIMILMRKSMDRDLYEEIRSHAGRLVMSYEMYMTFYEKSGYIDAIAVCGNSVVGYSGDAKADLATLAAEAQKILRKNGYKADVKILRDLRPFLDRLDSMNQHYDSLHEGIKFTPDSKYPELSRDELIKHTILAICL